MVRNKVIRQTPITQAMIVCYSEKTNELVNKMVEIPKKLVTSKAILNACKKALRLEALTPLSVVKTEHLTAEYSMPIDEFYKQAERTIIETRKD